MIPPKMHFLCENLCETFIQNRQKRDKIGKSMEFVFFCNNGKLRNIEEYRKLRGRVC